MRSRLLLCLAILVSSTGALAAETPESVVSTYDALADALLALKATEANFVRSLLDGHLHAAEGAMARGDHAAAAAEIALFANEGDNAIGGVRKRLLEGGHHHHSDAEATGEYEPGFVIVTAKAKAELLQAASQLRAASNDTDRDKAWKQFTSVANVLLATP